MTEVPLYSKLVLFFGVGSLVEEVLREARRVGGTGHL